MPDSKPLSRPQIITYQEADLEATISSVAWVPSSPRLVAAGTTLQNTGFVKIFRLGKELAKVQTIQREFGVVALTFRGSSLQDRRLGVGDSGGRVYCLDLEENKEVWGLRGHELVNCIDGAGGRGVGPAELVSGGREGNVKVWDTRVASKPVVNMEPESARRECWAVSAGNCHSDEERMIAAGYDNGDVKVWDLRTMQLYWETNVGNGVCGLEWDRRDIQINKLAAVTLEGGLHVWDCSVLGKHGKMAEVKTKVGACTVWTVRHSPHNRELLVTGAGGGCLALHQYEYPEKRRAEGEGVAGTLHNLQTHQISDQPINCVDWSPDKQGLLATASFDQRLRVVFVTKLNLL